jgi:hypothetical protein
LLIIFLLNYMEKQYLSMAEMSKICPYEQDYLSLLARQGKLEARKIGKKWFTTAEWVNKYLSEKKPGEVVKVNEKKNHLDRNKKIKYSWLVFGMSVLIFIMAFFVYQRVDYKISELESKTSELENLNVKNNPRPISFQSIADFFTSGKMEF